jgi:expansin (peptidoglycan-binding protein)
LRSKLRGAKAPRPRPPKYKTPRRSPLPAVATRLALVLAALAVACSSTDGGAGQGSGGATAAGGESSGGANQTGGAPTTESGGDAATETGGTATTNSGGANSGTGGTPATGTGGAPATTCSAEPSHTGQATYYTTADGSGNCSFDPSPNDLMIGAMNATDYEGSAACGGCAHLVGPNGDITIRIVDQCPECPQGNIDLSPTAFDGIAARSAGRVPITWNYVACSPTGPIQYEFKDGSNAYWTAVQIRNSRYRIAKFEVEKSGKFVEVARETYNYFVDASGMGAGPYTFRVTDVYGATVTDTGIALSPTKAVPGKSQFPACP